VQKVRFWRKAVVRQDHNRNVIDSNPIAPDFAAGNLLGDGRDRLDDHGRDHALQGLAALNEDNVAMTVMSRRAAMNTACKFRA
jgi:hypothetical protein